MNEWDFIDQDTFLVIGKSTTSFKFKLRRGYVRKERLVLSNPHSSYLGVTPYTRNTNLNYNCLNFWKEIR